jgi:hypothetical protein
MKCFYRLTPLVVVSLLCLFSNQVSAQDLTIGNYSLVSKERVGRTDFTYIYHAEITNTGPAVRNVTATVKSTSAHTVVVDGTLTFGDVPAGGTVISNDTFTIRQNRGFPFAPQALVWEIQIPPDPLTTVTGTVVDQDGHPVEGATVTCLDLSAKTRFDGFFSLFGVPTVHGNIRCTATWTTPEGKKLTGRSAAVAPVPEGITNVGEIVIRSSEGPLYPGPKFAVSGNPISVAVADLNDDGVPDLVTANAFLQNGFLQRDSGDVSVLLGNGDGTFLPQMRFAVGGMPYSVVVADLNADSVPDLVTANKGSGDFSVLLGVGDGTFLPQTRFATRVTPYSMAVADLNDDNVLDLVTATRRVVYVLLGVGDGTFLPERLFVAGSEPRAVAVADLNGDSMTTHLTR